MFVRGLEEYCYSNKKGGVVTIKFLVNIKLLWLYLFDKEFKNCFIYLLNVTKIIPIYTYDWNSIYIYLVSTHGEKLLMMYRKFIVFPQHYGIHLRQNNGYVYEFGMKVRPSRYCRDDIYMLLMKLQTTRSNDYKVEVGFMVLGEEGYHHSTPGVPIFLILYQHHQGIMDKMGYCSISSPGIGSDTIWDLLLIRYPIVIPIHSLGSFVP